MSDIRALLVQERQARRIQHPHASYSKSGALSCTACNLNIKSEALWEGHLKSANHRKNIQKSTSSQAAKLAITPAKSLKRKIEDVEEEPDRDERPHTDSRGFDVDNRKKSRPTEVDRPSVDSIETSTKPETRKRAADSDAAPPKPVKAVRFALETDVHPPSPPDSPAEPHIDDNDNDNSSVPNDPINSQPIPPVPPIQSSTTTTTTVNTNHIDESEWLAFERDLAPLTSAAVPSNPYTYSSSSSAGVITAAPTTTTATSTTNTTPATQSGLRLRDQELQDEKEDEQARIQSEFEVMQEMEGRVAALKRKREMVRLASSSTGVTSIPPTGDDDGNRDRDTDGDSRGKNRISIMIGDGDGDREDGDNDDTDADAGVHSNDADAESDSDQDVDDWYS